jgi:hypothetical protein
MATGFAGSNKLAFDSGFCCTCSRQLLAQSGHPSAARQCPLLGVKRTSQECGPADSGGFAFLRKPFAQSDLRRVMAEATELC